MKELQRKKDLSTRNLNIDKICWETNSTDYKVLIFCSLHPVQYSVVCTQFSTLYPLYSRMVTKFTKNISKHRSHILLTSNVASIEVSIGIASKLFVVCPYQYFHWTSTAPTPLSPFLPPPPTLPFQPHWVKDNKSKGKEEVLWWERWSPVWCQLSETLWQK